MKDAFRSTLRPTRTTSPNESRPARRFTGCEVRPVPDRIDQLLELFESCVFDDGFVEGHRCYAWYLAL